MAALDRIRAVLISLLAVLVAVLTAAIVLGVVLRPAPPLAYPVAEGRTIDHARNNHSQAGRWLHLPQHRVGVTVSCEGSGHLDVTIGTTAASTAVTRTSCSAAPGGAAYVLSTLPGTTYRWRVQSPTNARWAVTFSDPLDDGGGDLTP